MALFARLHRKPHRRQPPEWPVIATEATRVLVEHPDSAVRDILERRLADRGYAVLACAGPHPDLDGAVSCPLLHQEHCPGIDDADIVINALPMGDGLARIILHRTRTQHPDMPIIVEASLPVIDDHNLGGVADAHLFPITIDRLALLIDTLTDA